MTQDIYESVKPIAIGLLTGTCGGLVVLLFDHKLAIIRERDIRRRRFQDYIAMLMPKINALPTDRFTRHYPESRQIPQLEAEVLQVRQFIRKGNIVGFDNAFSSYKSVRFEDPGTVESNTSNAKAKADLLRYLNALSQTAN